MAKKGDDFDFEDLDFEDGDFDVSDDFDTSDDKGKKRGVAGKVLTGSIDALKDQLTTDSARKHAELLIKHSLEEDAVYSLDEIKYTLSSVRDNIDKELQPIKKNAAEIAKQVGDLLPDGKIKGFFGKIRDSLREDYGQSTAETKETLDSFRQSMESQFNSLNTALSSKNSEATAKLSGASLSIAQKQLELTAGMRDQDRAYYMKSLELHWKSNSYLEEMVTLNRKHFEVLAKQMEAVIKNTGLPDAVKLHTSELAIQQLKKSVSDSFFKRINPIEMFSKVINRKVSELASGVNEGLETALFPLEMLQMMADPEMSGGLRGHTQSAVSAALMWAAGKGYGKLANKFDPNKTRGISSNIIGLASNPLEWLKSKRAKSSDKGFMGKVYNKLISMLGNEVNYNEAADRLSGKNLGLPTAFDGLTHTTINTVIPTFLSKIHNELVAIRTGKGASADNELIFDATTGKITNKGALKKTIKKQMWEKAYAPVIKQGKDLANSIRKTLSNMDAPDKDKVLANLDKHLIGYMNRHGTISPDSLLTLEFLAFYPKDLQFTAADIFQEYINVIRKSGGSSAAYADFKKMSAAYGGSGRILNAHSYGASGMVLNEMGYTQYFGGETYSNRSRQKAVYNRLGSRKQYAIREEIGDYGDEYDPLFMNGWEGFKEDLKKDFANIKTVFTNLGKYEPENGDYGTAYTRFATDVVEQIMPEELIEQQIQEELTVYSQTDEMIKLKSVDPEKYENNMVKKEQELRKKHKQAKRRSIKEMVKLVRDTAKKEAQAAGILNQDGSANQEHAIFKFASNSAKFAKKVEEKTNSILDKHPAGKKVKEKLKGLGTGIADKAGKIGGWFKKQREEKEPVIKKNLDKLKEIQKEFEENGILETGKKYGKKAFNKVKEEGSEALNAGKKIVDTVVEDVKNDGVKATGQKFVDQALNSEIGQKLQAEAKKYKEEIEKTVTKENIKKAAEDIKEKVKKEAEELKENKEVQKAVSGVKGFIFDVIDKFKNNLKKEKIKEEPEDDDNVTTEEDKEADAAAKAARYLELKKKGSERTKEETKEYYNLLISRGMGSFSSMFKFATKPFSFITKTLWNAFKYITIEKLLPSFLEFSKFTRGLERQLYGNLFKKIKNAIVEMPKAFIKAAMDIPKTIGQKANKLLEGLLTVWNSPIIAALRSKEMEQIKGVLPKFIVQAADMAKRGVGLFKDLFNKDSENSWQNRLKRFKEGRQKAKEDKPKSEKKKGFWERLKGLFGFIRHPLVSLAAAGTAIKTAVAGFVPAITGAVGTVVNAISGLGSMLLKPFGFIANTVGKVVVGTIKMAGKAALHGGSALAAGAGKLAGKKVTQQGIAKSIVSTLKGFKGKILERLGKKAGGSLVIKLGSKIAARAVPIIGWSLVLYDAAKAIKYMTIDGYDLKSAISKVVLGFDLFNDYDPPVDPDTGEPIKPDTPDAENKAKANLEEQREAKREENRNYMLDKLNAAKEKWAKEGKSAKGGSFLDGVKDGLKGDKSEEEIQAQEKAKESAKKNGVKFIQGQFEKDLEKWKGLSEAFEKVPENRWTCDLQARVDDVKYRYGVYVPPHYYTIALWGRTAMWDFTHEAHTNLVYQSNTMSVDKDGNPNYLPLVLSDYVTYCLQYSDGKKFLAGILGISVDQVPNVNIAELLTI